MVTLAAVRAVEDQVTALGLRRRHVTAGVVPDRREYLGSSTPTPAKA